MCSTFLPSPITPIPKRLSSPKLPPCKALLAKPRNLPKCTVSPVADPGPSMFEWVMSSVIETLILPDPLAVEVFVSKHRETLLRYLDGKPPYIVGGRGAVDFVEQVLDEWFEIFPGTPLDHTEDDASDGDLEEERFKALEAASAAVDLRERTFWYALYQLEEVAEFPRGATLHPYEAIVLENLEAVREMLRNNEPLPMQYFATRPGEF